MVKAADGEVELGRSKMSREGIEQESRNSECDDGFGVFCAKNWRRGECVAIAERRVIAGRDGEADQSDERRSEKELQIEKALTG